MVLETYRKYDNRFNVNISTDNHSHQCPLHDALTTDKGANQAPTMPMNLRKKYCTFLTVNNTVTTTTISAKEVQASLKNHQIQPNSKDTNRVE